MSTARTLTTSPKDTGCARIVSLEPKDPGVCEGVQAAAKRATEATDTRAMVFMGEAPLIMHEVPGRGPALHRVKTGVGPWIVRRRTLTAARAGGRA
ncbi:hypothetical protein GCM10009101_06530 [Brevundimonas lenta]